MKFPAYLVPVDPRSPIDPAATKLVQEFKYSHPLTACRFDPSGRYAFAAARDNVIVRWELASGKKAELVGHRSWIRGLAFQSALRLLVSGDFHGRVIAWPAEADRPSPLWAVDAHRGWVRAVAASPDGTVIATGGNDPVVRLWAPDGRLVRELPGHASQVYNLAFHPHEPFLVAAELKGSLKQWDWRQGKVVRELDAAPLHMYDGGFRADIGGARGMAFDAAGSLLACAGITEVTNAFAGVGKPMVLLFDWATGKRKPALVTKEAYQGTAWGTAFHPAGYVLAVGGGNGGVLWFWKPDQPQAVHTMGLPNNARDLALHPDGRRLAVAFLDNVLRVYHTGVKGKV